MQDEDLYSLSFLLTDDNSHTLFSERFKATYHSTKGAVSESKHVFIQNGLQYIHEQFNLTEISVLEIGFGTGLNAFMTYIYGKENAIKINYHSIEAFPISFTDAQKLNYINEYSKQNHIIFHQLHQQEWNTEKTISEYFSITKYLSLLETFDTKQKFDVIYFDAFSPNEQPELWTEAIFKNMYDLLNVNGVLVTYCAQGQMKRNMKQVGFKVVPLPGFGGKREMTRAVKMV